MAHAYTPGLKVTERTKIIKKRILPLKGEVMVKKGDKVTSDTVVARTELPGPVEPINVANILGVPPQDVPETMLKKVGEHAEEGSEIAKSKSFFGLFTSTAKARIRGTVENISSVTGQVLLRGAPVPIEVKAYLNGVVTDVFENEGVEVSTWGGFVQGIFGIGPETHGPIKIISQTNKDVLTEKEIDSSCKGYIIIGGSLVTAAGLRRAIEVGAVGIVVGGFDDQDLRDFLGYDLGVAITGSEDKGITLVVTEGFGEIMMAGKTFELLKDHEGQEACINGATQIRAGVIRPEVVIPKLEDISEIEAIAEVENPGLEIGSPVRVIRQPYFGKLGKVTELPPELHKLESESKARVLEVEFADGERAIIPRANVEMIEK
jgi:transcription antitermination factor NusG